MARTLRFLPVVPVLFLAGCAHLTSYYEINTDGNKPFTSMGCTGPSSSATIEPVPGISVMADAGSRPMEPIKLRIEIYSDRGGQFAFTSGIATLSSPTFRQPIKAEMEQFTADYHEGFVAGPTDLLTIKPRGRFDTDITSAAFAEQFDLQLPDARANGSLVSFPVIHFKRALKAYIGVCEA